jgi:hypothetical protein
VNFYLIKDENIKLERIIQEKENFEEIERMNRQYIRELFENSK